MGITTISDLPVEDIVVATRDFTLRGSLSCPPAMPGVVIFAHGSGSTRFSPRNRAVAQIIGRAGMGTLLIDLLTPKEAEIDAQTAQLRFNIPFLANRLDAVVSWMARQPLTRDCRIGLFGASTGAAAAMIVAARRSDIAAVVSRGGRVDLAGDAVERVAAPVLLIVGANDTQVLERNRQVLKRMSAPVSLDIISGAGHLFEEGDALTTVARHAADWFGRCFRRE